MNTNLFISVFSGLVALGVAALWAGPAHAAGQHLGVPVSGVEGVGEANFQTPETGWTAHVEGAVIRVFVGKTSDQAREWSERWHAATQRTPTPVDPASFGAVGADSCAGDDVLMVCVDGNVGVMAFGAEGAQSWTVKLLDAIVDPAADPQASPWPTAPTLVPAGERWTVNDAGLVHVAFVGGRLARNAGLVFVEAPETLIGWDRYGRSAVNQLGEE